MHIELDSQWEAFLERHVRSGQYASRAEVVMEALRLLEEQEARGPQTLDQLRHEIDKGLASLDRGEYTVLEESDFPAYVKDVERRGLERLTNKDTLPD